MKILRKVKNKVLSEHTKSVRKIRGAGSAFGAILVILLVLGGIFTIAGVFGMPALVQSRTPIMTSGNCSNLSTASNGTASTSGVTIFTNNSVTTSTLTTSAGISTVAPRNTTSPLNATATQTISCSS